jgi:hypothetical protein
MNQSQRARQMLKEWGILAILLILLHAFLIGGWVILNPGSSRSATANILLMVAYLVLFAIIGWFFYKRVSRAGSPPEYREAREHGLPATAKILEIKRTRWRNKKSQSYKRRGLPTRFEYEMRVRVTRPGAEPYEAMLAEFLIGVQIPKKGEEIPVKVHPQRPEVIVMLLDPLPSQSGL